MRSPAVQFIFILLSALSAFTLAPAKSGVRSAVQAVFLPVAFPVQKVGAWASRSWSPPHQDDILSPAEPRNVSEVYRQNEQLITRLGNLEAQLDDLRQLSAQYAKLGDLTKLVHPAVRIGGSPTNRQTITIGTGSLVAVREKMAVVHPGGFVGQIYDVAPGGLARVLLATDPESRLSGHFIHYQRGANGELTLRRVDTKPPLFEGSGSGLIVRLPAGEVRKIISVGDAGVLDDPIFPAVTKGLRLGTVRRINLPATDSGFATIELDATANLAKLPEVLVVDR